MRTIQLVPALALFLSGCACQTQIQVQGDLNQLGFGVQEPYLIRSIKVSQWSPEGKLTPMWKIENANLQGVYYGAHSEAFDTTYEPSRLDYGVYVADFECVSNGRGPCKRKQLFAITAHDRDGLAMTCESREKCQSLILMEVTSR